MHYYADLSPYIHDNASTKGYVSNSDGNATTAVPLLLNQSRIFGHLAGFQLYIEVKLSAQ
jgi:hypothetical protein